MERDERKKNRWLMRGFVHDKPSATGPNSDFAAHSGDKAAVNGSMYKANMSRIGCLRFAQVVLLMLCLPRLVWRDRCAGGFGKPALHGHRHRGGRERRNRSRSQEAGHYRSQRESFAVFAERVGADAATLDEISRIPSKQINAMLNSLSIEEERTGPGRYIGKLTVRFLPRPAKALMNRLGVQYSEKVAGKTVVIPLWKAPDGTLQVWEDNPWRQAWLSLRAENSLVPVLVPLGDLTDTGLLTAEQAAANDEGSLEAIRLRYEAEAVLVAVAEPLGEDTVQATMVGDSPVGKLGFDKGYTAEQGGGLTEAAQIAAARFHEVMQLRWKKMNEARPVTQALPVATLPVAVSFFTNDEWSALRSRILATPGVSGVDISTISQGGAIVQLSYVSGFEQLRQALWQAGLALQNVGGTWVLQTN
jgi:hypothetical protein